MELASRILSNAVDDSMLDDVVIGGFEPSVVGCR